MSDTAKDAEKIGAKLGDGMRETLQAIEAALRMGFSPAEVLDENSPIRDAIRAHVAGPQAPIERIAEDNGPMCAVDMDNGLRSYPWTYINQPGNIGASVLGNCALRAKPGGDSIDHGLSLLRELHLQGLGIARVPALVIVEAKPHG